MQLFYSVYTQTINIFREGEEEILLRHSEQKKKPTKQKIR